MTMQKKNKMNLFSYLAKKMIMNPPFYINNIFNEKELLVLKPIK